MTSDPEQLLQTNLPNHAAAARRGMGLNIDAAAQLAGVDPALIEAVERGDLDPLPIADLVELAAFLGLTAAGVPRPPPPGLVKLADR